MPQTPSTVKRRALEQLITALQPYVAVGGPLGSKGIPASNFFVGDQGTEHAAPFPHLVARAGGQWEFIDFMDDQMWSTDDTQTVHLGDISGTMELVLGCTSQTQRELLEDIILSSFLRSRNPEGFNRTGILVVQLDAFHVDGAGNLAQVPVGYALEREAWDEEQVFERKRFSSLQLSVDLPCLVTRGALLDAPIYTIETLVLALTNDLNSNVPTDQVQVDDTGVVTNYTGP